MAKEIKWENLTPSEVETLDALVKSGRKVYAAPIEIEHSGQLETLGITWKQVRTWRIGSETVKVRLTPTDEATYKFILNELRARHRVKYRAKRCMVSGRVKSLIRCPECNRCSECPFPEYRERHTTNTLSWDALIGDGYEKVRQESEADSVETKMEFEAVSKVIDAKNPKFTKAIVLKEHYGMSVAEIAETMHESERNVYYYLSEAKRIGKLYKQNNG